MQEERFPLVIRPRPMTLKTWEELARSNPAFAHRLATQVRQLEAVARTILRHDAACRERFGDEETLVRYLIARLRR